MSNVIKFQAPFERIKFYNSSPEVSLFKAVITQAIVDASNLSCSKEYKKIELEAKAWIFGGSEDFEEICRMVKLTPSWVKKIAEEIIKLHADAQKLTQKNKIKPLEQKVREIKPEKGLRLATK